MFSTNSGSCAEECYLGPFFVQFTALKNATMRQLESGARKSIIISLRDQVKVAASVAICASLCWGR